MSFWVWVLLLLVVVLLIALVVDRRRRGGWRQGYSDADAKRRTDRQRDHGDRNSGEGYTGGGNI
jgi:hypothetical protein